MQHTEQKTGRRLNPSVIVAFHKLLKAARDGSEVLLLDMRDCHANPGIQAYNDDNAGDDEMFESAYGRFVDSLAEKFDRYANMSGTGHPKMPSKDQLHVAERFLESLLKRRETGGSR